MEVEAGVSQYETNSGLLRETTADRGKLAVLAWAVKGAAKYLAHGLRCYTPPEVTAPHPALL